MSNLRKYEVFNKNLIDMIHLTKPNIIEAISPNILDSP